MEEYITRREHDEYVKRMDDEHRRMNSRIKGLEAFAKEMQKMNTNIATLANNMKHILEEQHSQGVKLEALENDKNSNWDSLKKGIFSAIGAAIGGSIIAAILFFA